MSLFAELKRRNVFRVGIAYAVAAWILLQATDVVGEILELPPWGGKLILLMVVVLILPPQSRAFVRLVVTFWWRFWSRISKVTLKPWQPSLPLSLRF